MSVGKFSTMCGTLTILVAGCGAAWGQSYPIKSLRIVTSGPGSGADLVSRLLAQGLTPRLGQQVVVDNRTGSGVIAVQAVTKSQPDGSTVLLYGSNIWLLPFMKDDVPYDPVRDFLPITLAANSPNVLVVHPSLPVRSVKELIALAKSRPNELNYASGITASTPHMAAELLKSLAKISLTKVTYTGTSQALTDLMSGEVQLMFPVAAAGMPYVKAGRLRGLAVTSARPTELASGLPTMQSAGLPDYESVLMLGVYAPAKTPAATARFLNQEIVKTLSNAELKEKLFHAGADVVASSPEALMAAVKTDMARWGKVIKEAGIRAD